MKKKTIEQIEQISRSLLDGNIGKQALEVTLGEFQKFYATILHLTKTTPILSLVNLEDRVIAQFSNISPQHFIIITDKPLTEVHFEFAPKIFWYGSLHRPEGFWLFLFKELKQNFGKLFLVFIISAALLFSVDNDHFYELIISFLIQSSTVFLSLFVIFTVSQSQTLYKDASLFKSGILHKYFRDDRNVTLLGIFTITAVFLSSGIVSLLIKFVTSVSPIWLLYTSRATKTISITFGVVLLFDTFLTVTNYYIERNRDVIERDLASDILDVDYKNNYK